MSYSQNEDISAVYSDYILDRFFDERNRALYSKIESAFDDCFVMSKDHRFVEAEIQLRAGEAYRSLISLELQPWVTCLIGQRVSYFYYKIREFEKAIDISNQIIGSSRTLVSDGFQFIFFTEIQQLFNISRIFFAKKDESTALEYSTKCLQQILEQSSSWNSNRFIKSSSFSERELIFDMQYKMLRYIIVESYARAIKALQNDWYSFNGILTGFTTKLQQLNFEIPSGHYSCGDLPIFIKIAIHFFENGAETIDEAGADFIQSKHTDKLLLKILFDMAKIITRNKGSVTNASIRY